MHRCISAVIARPEMHAGHQMGSGNFVRTGEEPSVADDGRAHVSSAIGRLESRPASKEAQENPLEKRWWGCRRRWSVDTPPQQLLVPRGPWVFR